MQFYYWIYGKRICSDMEFPQLLVIKPCVEEQIEIYIQERPVPEDIRGQKNEIPYEFGEARSWLKNSTTWLVVEEGSRIQYERRENGNRNYLQTYILGFGMAMLHLQRNEMAFHCSALCRQGEAILITGESGSGKSTMTASLLKSGYDFMADDMAIIKKNGADEIVVMSGFPFQKLTRDMVSVSGYPMDKLIYINEQKDKFLIPYERKFPTEEMKVKAFFHLEVNNRIEQVQYEKLEGMEKYYTCVHNLFLRKLFQPQEYAKYFVEQCLEIASKIAIYRIQRPVGENSVSQIEKLIKILVQHEGELDSSE